ncbi:MAG: hypothetical protein OXI33_13425 [Chloroflexota bacterium]|nr:hypothetical protein [Chloroflexota bacterium]
MAVDQPITHESNSVRTHLEIVQGIIQRMAENSRSCKVWCVTLVSAILVLVARTGKAEHAMIALAPTVLFLVLDAYYLSLEGAFRKSYDTFVAKIHDGQASTSDLFAIAPIGSIARGLFEAMFRSFSLLPFYLMVLVTVLLAWRLVL